MYSIRMGKICAKSSLKRKNEVAAIFRKTIRELIEFIRENK